jgi:hypothetical protein
VRKGFSEHGPTDAEAIPATNSFAGFGFKQTKVSDERQDQDAAVRWIRAWGVGSRAAHKLNAIDKVVETRRHSHSDG